MGYATVMRVPRIADYAAAVRKLNNTKPIKGRDPVKVPLGERRDCDTYSIRKNIWNENIELVLYQTPVIKFTPQDELIINIDRWPSASTCQFISRVTGIGTNRVRGEVVLHFHNGTKHILGSTEELVLVRGGAGHWQPTQKQKRFDLRINRKGANAVRKRVSQFRDYLAGVLKLKAETITHNEGTYYEHTTTRVDFTFADLAEVLGTVEYGANTDRAVPNVMQFEHVCKPELWRNPNDETWATYEAQSKLFYELIRNDQDDNVRHQNYWIALNALVGTTAKGVYYIDKSEFAERKARVTPLEILTKLERFLFGFFCDEVFKKVELDDTQVSTGKYNEYVRKGD